ncbi:MAG: Hsp20 family protein [Clostridia bacterium]|nr:Hsp20 family protein [Clostridia bacterium]
MLTPALFESQSPFFNDHFFNSAWDHFFKDPEFFEGFHTDLIEKDQQYVLESELPGFNKEDISINLSNDILTISAEHKEESPEREKGKYLRRERSYRSYRRSFSVPGITPEEIDASYQNGILELKLPKKSAYEQEVKKIEVK